MPAREEARARSFYADLLGMTEITKPQSLAARGGAWFRSGDVFLHLGVDPDFRPATKAHPAFRCPDYDVLLERLTNHRIVIIADENLVSGSRHCYIADP